VLSGDHTGPNEKVSSIDSVTSASAEPSGCTTNTSKPAGPPPGMLRAIHRPSGDHWALKMSAASVIACGSVPSVFTTHTDRDDAGSVIWNEPFDPMNATCRPSGDQLAEVMVGVSIRVVVVPGGFSRVSPVPLAFTTNKFIASSRWSPRRTWRRNRILEPSGE